MPMPPTPRLETARLWLRPLAMTDLAASHRLFPRWEIVEHMPNVPWPYPETGTADHFRTALGEMARGEKSHWALVPKAGPEQLIGLISLWPDDGLSRDTRGFWLAPEHQGRGLMTEAADRINDYALLELGWPRLWLSNLVGNVRSARVKLRQGAELVGEETRTYVRGEFTRQVWLLTRERWAARRSAPSRTDS